MMSYLSDEAREKLDTFKAVMVKHARLRDVDQELALAIEEHADAAHLLFYGSTGVGKSTVLGRTWRRSGTGQNGFSAIPVVFIEARTSDTGTYVRMDYYRQVPPPPQGPILVKELLLAFAPLLPAPH